MLQRSQYEDHSHKPAYPQAAPQDRSGIIARSGDFGSVRQRSDPSTVPDIADRNGHLKNTPAYNELPRILNPIATINIHLRISLILSSLAPFVALHASLAIASPEASRALHVASRLCHLEGKQLDLAGLQRTLVNNGAPEVRQCSRRTLTRRCPI